MLKQTKATYVLKDVANIAQQQLVVSVKKTKFSIIIDETADTSTTKSCAVLVRYFDVDAEASKQTF